MKKLFVLLLCIILAVSAFTVVASVEVETLPEDAESDDLSTEKIVEYVKLHLEEISVIITLILTLFYNIRKHGLLNKSIGTLNNNAITVAENSNTAIGAALAKVENVAAVVDGFKEEFNRMLEEVRSNSEEKQKLEQMLVEAQNYLKTAKLANVELANEVAELLVLANIPNSKKEELYSRHLAAVGAIADAEVTEVKEDVEQSA
jgi:molybdopterin-biosynthesis enzyme MoeA-like protein